MPLAVLSGGAAQGLVKAMAPDLAAHSGAAVAGTYGAVGAMKHLLIAGAPADLLILTRAIIADLEASGHVVPGSARDIGRVRTAIAVRRDDPLPDVTSAALLKDALRAADAIYVPDTRQSTAGIHIARMLAALGIADTIEGTLREFPNGAAAMSALAASRSARPIGCTQLTEILGTEGVAVVRPLPAEFELATVYTAAVAMRAASPELAHRFAALLTGSTAAERRSRAGFDVE